MSTPPSSRPTPAPELATAPKTPKARVRWTGSSNVVVSVAMIAGASSAPNTPCAARAMTSIPKPVEAPPIADAAANPKTPMSREVRRPMRSDTRPPRSRRLPNASAYEVTIH